MIRFIVIILSDFIAMCRVCNFITSLKWLISICIKFREIINRKDLQPADQSLGAGPFNIKFSQRVKFNICGFGAISGVREMYLRDAYLGHGLLSIVDGDTVVDLGANMGNFSNLALAHGPQVRVVAIEPSLDNNRKYHKSVGLNHGFLERTTLIRAFIGYKSPKQLDLLNLGPDYSDAPWVDEDELIEKGNLTKVDFLKCDIEGGEFTLLIKNSKLLSMTKSLAIEIHAFAGNVNEFIENLIVCGFNILAIKWDPDGTCTLLAKRA